MAHKQTAIIIGAGAGGLALANMLAKAGMDVSIYEKNAQPGGRMGQLKTDGYTFDSGPSWYLMSDVFSSYFKLFDKQIGDYFELIRLDPAYKVFFETIEPVTITGDLEKNLKTFETLEPGAAEKLRSYIKRGRRHYDAALTYFLYNPFKRYVDLANREVIKASPSLLPMFSQTLHSYVARHFKRQELQQILEYPSVFLGASPFTTPALYQLMSYLDFQEGVFYPAKHGMHAVTEALVSLGKELDVKYHYNSPVENIITEKGKAIGITVDGKTIHADVVISNADLHFTEQSLLKPQDRSYSSDYWSKRQAGPSALLMYLGVKGELPELEHHNLFFVSAWKQNFDDIYKSKVWPEKASIYVSKTTATDAATAPKGHENIFVLVPLPAGADKDAKAISSYAEHYLEQLETMSGIDDLRSRIVVKEIRTPQYFGDAFNAWQNTALGMSHTLRQTAILRPGVKSKKVKNLYYVGGGTQPGIGVPMCIISAQLVYKHMVKDWSAGAPQAIKQVKL